MKYTINYFNELNYFLTKSLIPSKDLPVYGNSFTNPLDEVFQVKYSKKQSQNQKKII